MTKGTLSIHSENILPIIKKWLYSDKEIFVRELVSNACDAIHKVKVLRDRGETEAKDEEFRIDVTVKKEERQLIFADTGIGMSGEEVEKYIAQLAFSGAEDFMEHYKSEDAKDQIIGHFGLGFYSSYMVADQVEIQTRSYRPDAQAAHWSCDGSSDYELQEGSRETRGTEITLHVGKEDDEYLEEGRIKEILTQYCSFLSYPIYLNGERINHKEPLWLKSPAECTDEEYREFYRHLHPMEPDPLFWIHLNVDYPFNLKGILYFPKMRKDHDFQRPTISLYCNRVFVSEECKDLMPDFLMMLKGVIDSPDIPLNVSRSYLQKDRTVRQVAGHVAKKVADRLALLHRTEREQFLKAWPDIEPIVKMGALQDEKFYGKAKEFLIWKNSLDEWTTVEQYLERHQEKHANKIFYTSHEKHQTQVLDLYKSKGIEVLYAPHFIDSHLFAFLEGKLSEAKFQRIDGAIDEAILDEKREKNLLDSEGRTASSKLADLFRAPLKERNIEVEAKSLASDALPAFVMLDEQSRRMRDFMIQQNPEAASLNLGTFGQSTLVVNTNNPLVNAVEQLHGKDPELAEELVNQLYELALLSQREMDPESLNQFISRNHKVLENLAQKAAEIKS